MNPVADMGLAQVVPAVPGLVRVAPVDPEGNAVAGADCYLRYRMPVISI